MNGTENPTAADAVAMPTDVQRITLGEAAPLAVSCRSLPRFEQGDLRPLLPEHPHLYDPTLQVLEFRDCLVNRNGFVRLSSGEIITDIGYREQVEQGVSELTSPSKAKAPPQEIDESVILVGGHHNYYHWHLNWLPRLALADRFEDLRGIRPLITASPTAFMNDSLQAVTGRDPAEFVGLGWRTLRLKQVFIPAMFLNPMHAPFALRSYNGLRHLGAPGPRRKIYVSRAKARLRRILNDDEVSACLAGYGFETVTAEDLSYAQQVELFAGASHIVGAHGAGLTNMLFCSPGFSVIELFNQYYTKVYWSLCVALGGRRYRQIRSDDIVTPDTEEGEVNRRKNSDFRVDIMRLRDVIEDIGDHP